VVALAGVLATAALAHPARPATAPACATSGLVVWLDTNANGAAGSSFYELHLTNLSGHSCTLQGYPGVSAVTLSGSRIGRPASHEPGTHSTRVTLAQRATATATLRVVQTGDFSASSCKPTTAAGLRVYPPGQRASRVVPFPFAMCAGSVTVLSVRALTHA
jgi:hypothetical protein